MIVHRLLPDGGFVAGGVETGFTSYAYPTSPNAVQAKRNPDRTAEKMMAEEKPYLHASDSTKEYDARNWELLGKI